MRLLVSSHGTFDTRRAVITLSLCKSRGENSTRLQCLLGLSVAEFVQYPGLQVTWKSSYHKDSLLQVYKKDNLVR